MFDRGQYLVLMNMMSVEGGVPVDEALDNLERCVRAEADPCDVVRSLFLHENWRAHVIAATALAMGFARFRLRGAAWRCVDEGSWASPQLVAALSLADRHFVHEARARLAACRMKDAKRFGALRAMLARSDPSEGERLQEHWLVHVIRDMHAAAPERAPEELELRVGTQLTERWLSRVLARPGFQQRLVDVP